MVSVAYFVLGVCICLLVVIPYNRFHYYWTNETVAEFSWSIVRGVIEQDNKLILRLIEAHKTSDDAAFLEAEQGVNQRMESIEEDEE